MSFRIADELDSLSYKCPSPRPQISTTTSSPEPYTPNQHHHHSLLVEASKNNMMDYANQILDNHLLRSSKLLAAN